MADNNGLVPAQEKKKGFFYVLRNWREILAKDIALFGREQSVVEKEKEVTEKERAVLSREQQVNSKEKNVSNRETQVTERDEQLTQREQELKLKEEELKRKEEELARRESQVKKYEDFETEQQRQAEQGENLSRREEELEKVASTLLSEDEKKGITRDELLSRGEVIKRFNGLLSMNMDECSEKVTDLDRARKIEEETISESVELDEQQKSERLKQVRSASKKDKIMTLKMMQVKALAHAAVYIDKSDSKLKGTDSLKEAVHKSILSKLESICVGVDRKDEQELKRQYLGNILEDTGFSKGFEQVISEKKMWNGAKWCLDKNWKSYFPEDRDVQPADLFGFYVKGKGEFPGVVQQDGYRYANMELNDFIKFTPSELIVAGEQGLYEANHQYESYPSYSSEQISEAIKQNLTDFGYADPESIKKRGFEKITDADAQIQSLDTDDGR